MDSTLRPTLEATLQPTFGGSTEITPSVRVDNAAPQVEGVGNNSVFRIRSTDTELPLSADITFTYETVDGTAQAGLDFTKINPTAGTIPAAVGYVDIPVALLGPIADWAPPRSFSLVVSNVQQSGGDYPVSRPGGTGIITDSLPEPTVAISALGLPDPAEQNVDATQTHTVTLTSACTYDTLVPYATREGSGYTPKSGTATIPAGQLSVDIPIDILTTGVTEVVSYFVDLGNVTTNGYSLSVTNATSEGRIMEQDYLAPPQNLVATTGSGAGEIDLTWTQGTP